MRHRPGSSRYRHLFHLLGSDRDHGPDLLRLKWLSEHMDAVRPEPLHAHLQGFYKLRVGGYRIIYRLDQQHQLTVYFAGHRRNVYQLTARAK